ncbi:MAG TPA: hypothetical protein VK633_09745, partial [Verrucomicrobiae bacterium]|nr:hypothetical protein [Verrucomicrobiae bacterium]
MNTKRAKRLILLFAALLIVAAMVAFRVIPSMGAQKRLRSIRAEGVPVSPLELDAWYKLVPATENRALLILEAAKELVEPANGKDPNSGKLGSMNAGEEMSPALLEAISTHVAKNEAALKLLHSAAQLPESRYPVDLSRGMNTTLPHLARIRSLLQLLRTESVQYSHLGDRPAAVRSVLAMFPVASSLRNEPILIADLVRIIGVTITLNGLERVLSEHQLPDAELVQLSARLTEAEADGPRSLYRGLVGERACGIGGFKMSFSELEAVGGGPGQANENFPGGELVQALGFQAYRLSGLRERDLSCYLEMME